MKKLLIVEPLKREIVEEKAKEWCVYDFEIDYYPQTTSDDFIEILAERNYDALIVRNMKINAEIIEKWAKSMPSKKLAIIRAGSNISTIDIKSATEKHIYVMNTPGANSQAVAQFVISQFFLLSNNFRQMNLANNDVKSSISKPKNLYSTHTFNGDKLAIIGTGCIGSRVAQMALGLGIEVQAYSPCFTRDKAAKLGVKFCHTIEEAVSNANYISLQVPFTIEDNATHPKTLGMVNYKLLTLAAPGAKLINVSRCDVVNLNDLEQLIKDGRISGVSLDILSSEVDLVRQKHSNLFNMENILITPLIACESLKADIEITTQALAKAENFLKGEITAADTVNL